MIKLKLILSSLAMSQMKTGNEDGLKTINNLLVSMLLTSAELDHEKKKTTTEDDDKPVKIKPKNKTINLLQQVYLEDILDLVCINLFTSQKNLPS